MFLSDRPIGDEQDDELRRARFSRQLGQQVLNIAGHDSKVIAIYGDWGSGKTSILNLAMAHIRAATSKSKPTTRPIILEFNPWIFADPPTFLFAFLKQMFSVVNDRLPARQKDFQKQINGLAKALGVLAALPAAGVPANVAKKTIDAIVPEPTVDSLRAKIDRHFASLPFKVITIIDDIDRLSEAEMRQVFQLVKLIADFPNTVYLLAFDREVVEKALASDKGLSGRDYLDKIVEVGFDIPATEPGALDKYLFPRLDDVVHSAGVQSWDKTRWGNLFYGGLRQLFRSIRDVKRFLNGLAFTLPMVASEVDPIDFIGIEAIRVFFPEIYRAIAENRDLFLVGKSDSNPNQASEGQRLLDNLFETANRDGRLAKEICLQLFPRLRSFYPMPLSGTPSGPRAIWRKERRICSDDAFDVYFVMGIPLGKVSRSEIRSIVELANQPSQLQQVFDAAISEGRIRSLLGSMEDILDDLSEEGILGVCAALVAVGDRVEDIAQDSLDMEPQFQLQWLIYNALKRVADVNKRFDWLLDQVRTSPSLYPVVQQTAWHLPSPDDPAATCVFDPTQLDTLKQSCVGKIQVAADAGQLSAQDHFAELLATWKAWALDKSQPDRFADDLASNPQSAMDLAAAFVVSRSSFTFGDHVSRERLRLNLESLEKVADVEKLKQTLAGFQTTDRSQLSERELVVVDTLLRGVPS